MKAQRGFAPPKPSFWCGAVQPRRTRTGTSAGDAGPRTPAEMQARWSNRIKVPLFNHFATFRIEITLQVGWSGGALPLRESPRFGPVWRLHHQNGPKQRLCRGLHPPRPRRRRYHLNGYGVPFVDETTITWLVRTASAARLLSARCVLIGIRPEVAEALVTSGVDLTGLTTRANLRSALCDALSVQLKSQRS